MRGAGASAATLKDQHHTKMKVYTVSELLNALSQVLIQRDVDALQDLRETVSQWMGDYQAELNLIDTIEETLGELSEL